MTHRPLAVLAISFAVGAALPSKNTPSASSLPAPTIISTVLALSPVTAPLAFAATGWIVATHHGAAPIPRGAELATTERYTLEGRIESVPEQLGDRVRFTFKEKGNRRLLASTPDLAWPLAMGDALRFEAYLRAPESVRNPGGRDRAADLAARGIAGEAFATSPPVRMASPSPLAIIERGRRRFAESAERALPPRESALVRAIGAGDRSALTPELNEAFARSGLAHLLSVSGLHLAVVIYGFYRVLHAILVRIDRIALHLEPRRWAAAVALPFALLYAVATGADVPVVRSALATTLVLFGVILDREVDGLNTLAWAALSILAFEPGALRDPSFQLSFASVAGLTLGAHPLRQALPFASQTSTFIGRIREQLLSATCASVVATAATAPIVAFHFRRLSLMAVFSNLAGIPLGAALTVTAAAAAIASNIVPWCASALLWLCRPLAWLLLSVNDLFSPSWASLRLGSPGLFGTLLATLSSFAALRLHGKKQFIACALAATSLLGFPPLRRAIARHRGGLETIFLSVGQGDATAFLLSDGTAVLVDGGGSISGHYDPGARDVVPFLLDAGVRRLSAVFLSHPHPDHMLGLVAVAEAFPVEHFFTNGRRGSTDVVDAWAHLPQPEILKPGAVFERAGVRFEVRAPPVDTSDWEENDASLVLSVRYGATSFLLCGDLEAQGEAALSRAAGMAPLRSDVVKVPHHGSATSSTPDFVVAVHPSFAIMMVGRDNRFGFPSAQVIERWRAIGAETSRTDQGAVRFLSDGRHVRKTPAESALDPLALSRERL